MCVCLCVCAEQTELTSGPIQVDNQLERCLFPVCVRSVVSTSASSSSSSSLPLASTHDSHSLLLPPACLRVSVVRDLAMERTHPGRLHCKYVGVWMRPLNLQVLSCDGALLEKKKKKRKKEKWEEIREKW